MSDKIHYVKLTNKTCIHNGFEFKEGLNTDTIPFNIDKECCAGGIYFCRLDDIFRWLNYNNMEMYYIWDVKIPKVDERENDVKVMIYENKIKASSIILSNKRKIEDLDIWNKLDFQLKAIKWGGYSIQYIKNPSEEIKLEAVKKDGNVIRYIKYPSEEIQLAATRQDGLAIQYIKDPSEDVQLEAVIQDENAIDYIKYPSDRVYLEAIRYNYV